MLLLYQYMLQPFKDSKVYSLLRLRGTMEQLSRISPYQFMANAIKILCLHSILNRCTRNCICTYNAISNVFTTNKQYSRCTFEFLFIAFHGYYYGSFQFVCSFISESLSHLPILSLVHRHHPMSCSVVGYHLFGWLSLETFTFVATLSQPANFHSFFILSSLTQ